MLKIESWSLHAVALPYNKPIIWPNFIEPAAPLLFLRLVGTDGSVGVGEVTVKLLWYGVSYKSIVSALEDIFLPMACSMDVTDPSAFYEAARSVAENQSAKALVDNALWDLHASSSGRPLWQQWNGDRFAKVSWIVTRQAPKLMIDEAIDVVERLGIKTLKMKGGQGIDTDLQVMREVQAAVGSMAQVYVDANWHYTAEESVEYISRLADLGVIAVEDPYSLGPDSIFERIQKESRVPILVDFFVSTLRDVTYFNERGIQALSLKPARVGLSECLLQERYAQSHEIRTSVGFGGESSVGTCSAIQLAGSLHSRNEWLPAEVTVFMKMGDDLLLEPLQVKDGAIRLPDMTSTAGLLDFDKIKRLSTMQIQSPKKG